MKSFSAWSSTIIRWEPRPAQYAWQHAFIIIIIIIIIIIFIIIIIMFYLFFSPY